ncbi:hypothetical protein [Pseudomonas folii]|uniref:Uncharacterized protein n=1 Tax=Pseudomonas folii TaxID=2762593 RepID=A0ABR7B1S7_9PSED|nr:hypothetical protein [Pseudomonas folii]MBC3951089.1 hypothetical protein [Pseudomonas folii]
MAKIEENLLSEKAMDNLEGHIPEIAAGATYAAYVRALASGHTVLRVQGGDVVESNAEGSHRVVASAKPRRKVRIGEVIKVRRLDANA